MAIISISTIESEEQISSGIPRKISIFANIICNIHYTLDGTDPDLFSDIYTDTIITPTDKDPLILKVFATDGVDSSPIFTYEYSSNLSDGVKLSRVTTLNEPGQIYPNRYPYGSGDISLDNFYTSSSNSGENVNDPSLPRVSDGYNAEGEADGYTNLPFTLENYKIKYSTTDYLGQYGRGIGNLPGSTDGNSEVRETQVSPPPQESYMDSKFFDPRAFVIFQDVSKEDPNEPAQINRQFFSLESNSSRDGTYLYNTGDVVAPSGAFLRSYYNPRDETMTYYYYDNKANRWLISKTPYQPKPGYTGELYNSYMPRQNTIGKVYQWRMFARRVLF